MEQNESTLFVSSRDAAGLNQRVYEHILRQIIEVQIEPGERINVTKIAEQLQISRTPIRSAMDQLVKDGLIKRVSDRGYQVTPINMADCFNLCDARKILEGTAAVMAASNITSPELEILEHSIAGAKECLACQDYDAFAEQDTIFHETLLRAAGNRYLLQVYDTLKIRINRYRYIISTYCRSSAEQDTSHAIAKHLCIFRAIKNRYSSVAQNEMEEHIAYTYRTLFDLGYFIRKNGLE